METFELYNGLRVVCATRPGSALAVVNVLYNVGSRDENRQLTGIAHLFEHLMFGGSANVAEFDAELEAAGGNSNAWTSTDFTNFYEVLPACNLSTAFHLESDRMLALDFSESSLDVQRSVVVEEFKQTCLNRPYGDLMHHLRAMCYDARHPYSWPTIGLEPEHILNTRLDDIRHWFYSHYAPNNAVLSVTSPFPAEKIAGMAQLWFGDIPRREIASRQLPQPGFPTADVRKEVRAAVPQARIVMALPMEGYGSKAYYAADTITDILSYGKSSRCYRNLVHGPSQGLFASADASIIGSEEPGLLLMTATLGAEATDENIALAESMMRKEFERLASPGDISTEELQRTLNNFEATFRFEGMDKEEAGFRRAMAVMHGENPEACVAAKFAQTPAEIAEAAASMASGPMATLVYRPR